MTLRLFILTLFCISGSLITSAQYQGNVFIEDSTIKVHAYGSQRQLAWSGGFNNPNFCKADLNRDGKEDLVIFEWGTMQVKTFLNTGSATLAHYSYAPKYALNFPADMSSYLYLVDYNRDGVSDLVEHGPQGFNLFKGYYNAANELAFTHYKILRFNSPVVGNINAYSQNSDIPGIADVDHDGDLDFFGFNEQGAIIYFYKNCQEEQGLPKDTVRVCLPSNCWGAVFQGFTESYHLGITCNNFGTFNCRKVNATNKNTLHSGNAMCILDYDGDGDYDLLDGNISFSSLQYLENGKAQYGGRDSMISQDTAWQAGGVTVNMPYWPAAFHVDADGDGKKDLLVSPHAQSVSEDYKCIAFYKNTGTASVPVFTYQKDTFLIDQAIDAGTGAYPVAYDYNKDGRPDLIVGSKGYYHGSGTPRSRLLYFQNTLVMGETRLVLQSPDFLNLSTHQYYGAAPAFGDLDNDGADDMVIGHEDGTLSFYKNMAPGTAVPQWVLAQQLLKSSANDTINVGYSAAPFIYDINKDGKADLLIGQNNGYVYYYQNGGAANQLQLIKVSTKLGGMEGNPDNLLEGNSTLYIGKMDNTGRDYILLGNGLGTIKRYHGFQSGNVTIPYSRIDSVYSNIDVGANSAVTVADFNGDGKYELIAGNELGGLNLFRQVLDVSTVVGNAYGAAELCTLYPNPATHTVYLSWDHRFSGAEEVQVQVMNMTGQTVYRSVMNGAALNGSFSVDRLPAGAYMCLVRANGKVFASRFVVTR